VETLGPIEMPGRNITKFDVTPNLASVGVTEFYFNNDSLAFEFVIIDKETSTITTPEIVTEKLKLKQTDNIVQDIKEHLFPAISQYEDRFSALENEIETQIEDSSEELQDRVNAIKNSDGDVNSKESQSIVIYNLAHSDVVKFFNDQYENTCALIKIGNHYETLRINESRFERHLRRLYRNAKLKIASAESITSAVKDLQADAEFDGEKITLSLRTAFDSDREDVICYDLTDPL
jgi:hypothetical protein